MTPTCFVEKMNSVYSPYYECFVKTFHAERVVLDNLAMNPPDYDCTNCNCYGFPCKNCQCFVYNDFIDNDSEFLIVFDD